MIWQDVLIMISVFGLSVALIPSIRSANKPALKTCLISFVFVTAITIAFMTLQLRLSAIAEGLVAVAWLILLIQQKRSS